MRREEKKKKKKMSSQLILDMASPHFSMSTPTSSLEVEFQRQTTPANDTFPDAQRLSFNAIEDADASALFALDEQACEQSNASLPDASRRESIGTPKKCQRRISKVMRKMVPAEPYRFGNHRTCLTCRQEFPTPSQLQNRHLRNYAEPHVCAVCGAESYCPTHKTEHQDSHLDPDTGKYICPASGCGKLYGRWSHLERHGPVHSGSRPFRCEQCTRTFMRKDTLKAHVARQHKSTPSPSSSR